MLNIDRYHLHTTFNPMYLHIFQNSININIWKVKTGWWDIQWNTDVNPMSIELANLKEWALNSLAVEFLYEVLSILNGYQMDHYNLDIHLHNSNVIYSIIHSPIFKIIQFCSHLIYIPWSKFNSNFHEPENRFCLSSVALTFNFNL